MVDGAGKTTSDDDGAASGVGNSGTSTGATQHHGDSTDGMPHGGEALDTGNADSRHGGSAENIRLRKHAYGI